MAIQANGYKWVGDRRVAGREGGGTYVRQSLWLSFVYLVQWLRQPFFGRVRWLKQICLSLIVVVVCVVVRWVQVALGSLRWAFAQHPHRDTRSTPTYTHPHTRILCCVVASCYAPTKSQRFSRLVLFLVCLFVRVQIGYCDNTPHQRLESTFQLRHLP